MPMINFDATFPYKEVSTSICKISALLGYSNTYTVHDFVHAWFMAAEGMLDVAEKYCCKINIK